MNPIKPKKPPRETIANLKSCVKLGGYILIEDAYLVAESDKSIFPDYDTFEATTTGYLSSHDELVLQIDYRDSLWDADYQRTREVALGVLECYADDKEKRLVQRYLEDLAKEEVNDEAYLGLAIWVLKVL